MIRIPACRQEGLVLCLGLALLPGSGCETRKGEPQEEPGVVRLKEESQKIIGLEFVTTERRKLESAIEVVGEIAKETENTVHLTSPESGTLKSYLRSLGETVEKGTPVCVIETKAGQPVEIPSPGHGIVLAQYLKPGDPVDPLTSILTLADPDLLRASFNVYEKDLAGIETGQKVWVKSIAYPEKEFEGKILFISPSVDEKTRTIKIRVDVKNEEHLLKFGMFVTGEILVSVSEEVITLSEEAVQQVEGKSAVFIPLEGKRDEFVIKEVRVGRKAGERTEIIAGLSEGDRVAGKGSFYLKSELLKGNLEEGHAD